MKHLIFVIAFALGVLVAFPLTAQTNNCDALLVDNAHLVGPTGMKNITAAANELTVVGADVRVRTEKDLGRYANPDYLENALEQSCPSWQSPSGGRKNNLIVVMFVKPDWSAIYAGGEFAVLKTQNRAIATQMMNPKVRGQNYPGALVAGLKGIKSVLDGKLLVASPPITTPAEPHGTTATPVPVPAGPVYQTPTDYSGFWAFLKLLLGFCAVALTAYAMWKFFSGRNADKEIRQGAQQEAQLARDQVSSLIVKMTDDVKTFEEFNQDKLERVNRVKSLFNAANESFANLRSSNRCNPEVDGLTETQYRNMTSRYNEVHQELRQAQSIMDDAESPAPKSAPRETPQQTPPPTPISNPTSSNVPPESPPIVHRTTIIQHNYGSGGSGDVLPFLVGQELGREEERNRQLEDDARHPYINEHPTGIPTQDYSAESSSISVRAGSASENDNSGISVRAESNDPATHNSGLSTSY